MTEAWVLVNMNLERLFAVFMPLKVKIYFTKNRAGLGLILTVLGVLALNLVYIPTMKVHDGVLCSASAEYAVLMQQWYWVDFVFSSALPFLLMTGCSIAIVGKILYTNINRQNLNVSSNISISSMTTSMLLVALCFLLLTAPLTIMSPLVDVFFEEKPLKEALSFLGYFYLINFCFYVLNFYIYCVSNPIFRREFSSIICRVESDNKKLKAIAYSVTLETKDQF